MVTTGSGSFTPILIMPTTTAPLSTARPPPSTFPKRRPVEWTVTVPEALRLPMNSPAMSADFTTTVSGQRSREPSGMISRIGFETAFDFSRAVQLEFIGGDAADDLPLDYRVTEDGVGVEEAGALVEDAAPLGFEILGDF